MKPTFIRSNKIANWLVATVLALVPFHAFLTIWGSQLVGHYTALRLWSAVLLIGLMGICVYWLVKDAETRQWFLQSLLIRLIGAYIGLTLLLGLIALLKGDVTAKALGYGVYVNLRFLIWFLAVLLAARYSNWLRLHWRRLVLIPAAVVIGFACLQYTVLPTHFLEHFGYGPATIEAIETINNNPDYIRVQSTLRGANPLGAYMVLILSLLGVLYMAGRRRIICVLFGIATLLALFASGSRSAWAAAALSVFLVVWLRLRSNRAKVLLGLASMIFVLVAFGGFLLFRSNTDVQNAIFHTEDNSTVAVSSNDAHASAVSDGLRDAFQQPFGAGPGTAGPSSVYNTGHEARIAENYFVQIAQEVGWIGVALLVSVMVLIAIELYRRNKQGVLALALFASLLGLTVVSFVSHVWVDDTLAFLWWGCAGIALAQVPASASKKKPKPTAVAP